MIKVNDMKPEDIKLANAIQNACNPLAVINELLKMAKAFNGGHDSLNNYPPYLAVLGKLCDLANVSHDTERCYGKLPLE
jgi:hypothetical protein